MRVGRPRIRPLVAGDEVRERGGGCGPQAERAVDVDPCARAVRDFDDPREIVDGAGVHLARLRADDGRHLGLERVGERGDVHAPLGVRRQGHLLLAADPQQAERSLDRHVTLAPDHDPKRRRPGEPLFGEVPIRPPVDPVTRRREAGDVGHLAAGHEGERRLRRQAQQLEHPLARDRFEGRRRGGHLRQTGVLVPGRDEPVRRHRTGQRSADHEPEVAAGAHRDETFVRVAGQLLDDLERVGGAVWEWTVEQFVHPAVVAPRADVSRPEALHVVGGELCGPGEDVSLRHGGESTRRASRRSTKAVAAPSTTITSQIHASFG